MLFRHYFEEVGHWSPYPLNTNKMCEIDATGAMAAAAAVATAITYYYYYNYY